MIIVKNRELLIPNNERYIGTTYDTETENRVFQVPRFSQRGVDLAALTFRLDIQYANESYDTVILDKEVGEAYIILIWKITSATLQVPGTLYIGIRAVDDEATVKWSSFSAAMYAERHLNTPGNYGGSLTEIEQMEQDHQYMKGVVDELKSHLDYTHEAEAWAIGKKDGEAVPSTDETYHNNAKYYSNQANTKATQAANSATAAANSATQAAETVADTNTRFNNAMAAVTSETEVIDARVGADGTQYTVLKNRLDAEHNQLKNALEAFTVGKIKLAYKIVENSYPNAQGGFTPYLNWNRTDYIEVSEGVPVYVDNPHLSTDNAWYDANKGIISRFTMAVGSPTALVPPSGAKYMVISNAANTMFTDIYLIQSYYATKAEVNQKDGIIDNVNIKADDKLNAVLFDGDLKEAYVAYKRGGVNLLTGEFNPEPSVMQYQMVDWMFNYIPLESDDVTVSVKSGYQVRGVLFNPDKTYNTWFNWSTGGTISALNNKKGYFVRFVVSKVDGTALTDSEVSSAGIDTMSVSANLGLSGGLIAKVLDADSGKFYGKKIVNFGDSIFGNFRDTNETTDKSISRMIAEATGATVYNCGFGGCRMAYHSAGWRAFSMYALADAIATGVWTDQDAAIASPPTGMPSYFADTLALLKSIDFSTVDYITIGYGVNDFTGNVLIDAQSGLEEYQYFKGALEYSIRTILTAYPNIRILDITPCWIWYPNADTGLLDHDSDDPTAVNTRNLTLPDYVDACKTVCEKYHVPCIDTYTELGFNPYSYKAYFNVKGVDGATVSDGTHPKQAGRQLRADRIVGQMEALY